MERAERRGVLAAASDSTQARRLGEVRELEVAVEWAVRHGHPRDERDPMVEPGGDGTPAVREFAIPELAMARDTHAATTRSLMADGLDLVHRLPRTWEVVRAGTCEPWVARKVAVMSRALDREAVAVVDVAVARAIAGHAPSSVLEIAQAKVIEADPAAHAAKREVQARERYVALSRSDEVGYRCVIAKVTAGDAAWIDAMVDRVADILQLTHGVDHNRGELRSMAMGWLARPVDLLRLLVEHTAIDPDQPDTPPVWWAADLPALVDRVAAMTPRQLSSLRGDGRLFVHVTDEAIRTGAGVARVEGVGPVDVAQLHELLGHAHVTVTPVLDLRFRRRVDAYEHPEAIKDHVWAQCGGDVFPFSNRSATRAAVDFDHSVPFDPGGPPGQTGAHNCGPLRRRHHRWKTFGGYRCRTAGPGRHVWQTPHGLCLLVDHRGTRRLDPEQAEVMLSAPAGVEMYVSDVELAYG